MKILSSVFYMYAIAAIISFLVAFIIKSLFLLINKLETIRFNRINISGYPEPTEIIPISKEAENVAKENEVFAAISVGLHLYLTELHDRENAILTINKVAKTYSPWSSKIYGVNQWKR